MRRKAAVLRTLAQLGHAHWFFGNLYEAVVKVPDRLAHDPEGDDTRMASLFAPGSPVRYYLPGAPLTIAATVGALASGEHSPRSRRWLTAAASCSAAAVAMTAYLVRTVNAPLFTAGHPLTAAEQRDLLDTWYRLNRVRLAMTGGALVALHRAGSGSSGSSGSSGP